MYDIISKYKGHKVFIDIYEELPCSRFKSLVIMCEGHSKFVKLFPVCKANTKTFVKQVQNYIKQVGSFEYIISDNGICFQSKILKDGMTKLGISYWYLSVYHPQSNLSERPLKEVGRILITYLHKNKHNLWYKYIKQAEFMVNRNFHETTGFIPKKLMSGKKLSHVVFKLIKYPKDNQF